MKIHFIAIGGSAMHNLAIALSRKGYEVSGSDDEIFEPASSRLAACGLLPAAEGWFPERITPELDAVILGMHARFDNPELIRARELGIRMYSYPEFLYEQSKDKKRIVIGGSHGKTTITAMILHVLSHYGVDCNYMVGAQLEGFDVMVRLSDEAPLMIIEGDEYLTSPLDRRPKFFHYKPHIALISGIAWDHMNVFPTFPDYSETFSVFVGKIMPEGTLVYCSQDAEVVKIANECTDDIKKIPYALPRYSIMDGITFIEFEKNWIPLKVFGIHNLLNIEGARRVCNEVGITDEQFYQAISSFKGASKRLERIAENKTTTVFKDFAHSPSKLKATTLAVKEQFPKRTLVACMELHTYSSLNKDFLIQYCDAMAEADVPIVFFSPHALALKQLPPITEEQVKQAFNRKDLQVFTSSVQLRDYLLSIKRKDTNLLMMSSGNFDGMDLASLARQFTS